MQALGKNIEPQDCLGWKRSIKPTQFVKEDNVVLMTGGKSLFSDPKICNSLFDPVCPVQCPAVNLVAIRFPLARFSDDPVYGMIKLKNI